MVRSVRGNWGDLALASCCVTDLCVNVYHQEICDDLKNYMPLIPLFMLNGGIEQCKGNTIWKIICHWSLVMAFFVLFLRFSQPFDF